MSSASFTLTIDQTKRLSGMISGKDGFAIAGATVRLYPLEATSGSSVKSAGAPLLLSKSPGIQQASGFYEAITGSDGKYSFILNNYGDFRLVVSKDGYNTAYQDITISDKSTIVNMTLYSAYESLFATLRKYVTYNGYGLGYGAPGISTYSAVGFSATEMNPYKGYKDKIHTVYCRWKQCIYGWCFS